MEYRFALNTNAHFGHSLAKEAIDNLKESNFFNVGIVIDEGVYDVDAAKSLMMLLEEQGLRSAMTLKSRGSEEPDYNYLDECAAAFKKYKVDCMIGIGGGSAMDLCKGISILMTNPGKGVDYRGMNKVTNPNLPTILFPTTAGSGSEATATAVFLDKSTQIKLGINGKNVGAMMAFLDSDFTASCPQKIAVSSGLDAMVHALESYMTTGQNPIIWRIAIQAWVTIFRNFAVAVTDRENCEARLNMLQGSYLAGTTLMYSGGGIAGALSYPLGGEFKIPHGIAGGIFLSHIMEANISKGYEGYAFLHDQVFPQDVCIGSSIEKSKRLLGKFKDLLSSVEAPLDLQDFNISKNDIQHIVKSSIEQRKAVLQNNPVPVDAQMLTELLERVLI